MQHAAELGYNVNNGHNGIMLPNKRELAKELGIPYHPKGGRHTIATYTGSVRERLRRLERMYAEGSVTDATLLDEIASIEESILRTF